jgi:transposase
VGRGDLTNGQWARLELLLPLGKRPGRPPTWTRRQLIDGIRWRARTGAPWRDVPERYGPWDRVYDLFRRWQRDGTWKRIFELLQAEADAKGLIAWDVSVDSTIARAHQHAAGSPQTPPGCSHQIRQARCPLRGNRAGCSDQRVAVTTHTARSMHTS